MTVEQDHVNAIGKAQIEVEEAAAEIRQASRRLTRAIHRLHTTLAEAEEAYGSLDSTNVVAFSGGTNKPPADDPDEPVDPVP